MSGHPDGERISEYLETDTYLGGLIVPEKFKAKYKDKHRAAKYDYLLKRGLPIPPELMPKDEREKYEMAKQLAGKGGEEYQPQIALAARKTNDTSKEERIRIKSISSLSRS